MSMMETAAQAAELAPGGTVPEWVHILPLGNIEGRDGRNFNLPNPAAVIEAFAANGADLPVDFEHQAANAADKNGPIPAAGWIKALKATAEGVFAKIDWTDRARGMIQAKEYRYISPVIVYDKATRQVGRISGAGLVHRPNLQLQALNAQEPPPKGMTQDQDKSGPEEVASVLRMLGLSPDATASEAVAALLEHLAAKKAGSAKQGAPEKVEVSAVQSMLEEAAQSHAVTIARTNSERVMGKIARAVEQGFITPGMRSWAEALCSQSEASFDDFCAKAGPTFGYLLKPAAPGGTPQGQKTQVKGDPVAEAICAQLGLKPDALSR
jgi:phage I-like protein